jgi:hypothetical protein
MHILPQACRAHFFECSARHTRTHMHAHTRTIPTPLRSRVHLLLCCCACRTMRAKPFAALSVLLCLAYLTRISATTPPAPGTWMLAPQGLSCSAACAARSPPASCHVASLQSVASELYLERIKDSTLNHTIVKCMTVLQSSAPHSPSVDPSQVESNLGFLACYMGNPASTCEASEPSLRRFCCCGDSQCSNEYVPRWQSEGLDIPAPAIYHRLDLYVCLSHPVYFTAAESF